MRVSKVFQLQNLTFWSFFLRFFLGGCARPPIFVTPNPFFGTQKHVFWPLAKKKSLTGLWPPPHIVHGRIFGFRISKTFFKKLNLAKFNQNSLIFKNSKIQFSKFLKTKILSKTKKPKFPKNPKPIKKHPKTISQKIKTTQNNSYYQFLIGFTGTRTIEMAAFFLGTSFKRRPCKHSNLH